jgi:uncharacterized phage protein (TIGR02220 family)
MSDNKDSFWFRHDANARRDLKMINLRRRTGWDGVGLFWALVETMREEDGYSLTDGMIDDLGYELRAENLGEIIAVCIEVGLFERQGNRIFSPALNRRMEAWDASRERKRKAARARWHPQETGPENKSNADAKHAHSDSSTDAERDYARRGEREDKIGEDKTEEIREAVSYLNEKTGRSFKATTESTKRHICARLREGMTADDLKAIVDHKSREWKADPKMAQYLRPETLFGSKAESYLEAARSSQPKRSNHIVPVPCPDCGALNDPDGHICRECKRDFTETFRQMHEEGL